EPRPGPVHPAGRQRGLRRGRLPHPLRARPRLLRDHGREARPHRARARGAQRARRPGGAGGRRGRRVRRPGSRSRRAGGQGARRV
ncbi:MAG: hypothetical protein AVDCRST_MAG13-921, partial [uncultured Solirubrobacteraceae bacterium]